MITADNARNALDTWPRERLHPLLREALETIIALTEQIDEARETVNDLHAFGRLQTPEADLLLLHLKDQP